MPGSKKFRNTKKQNPGKSRGCCFSKVSLMRPHKKLKKSLRLNGTLKSLGVKKLSLKFDRSFYLLLVILFRCKATHWISTVQVHKHVGLLHAVEKRSVECNETITRKLFLRSNSFPFARSDQAPEYRLQSECRGYNKYY